MNIEDIAKRRGFYWQTAEIYGGLGGFYDYGHLGTLLKKKWEEVWRSFFLDEANFYEITPSSIVPENVLIASGHVKSFVDPVVKCRKCGFTERADHLLETELKENFEGFTAKQFDEIIEKHKIKCPKCKGTFGEAGTLNMMFPLNIGTGEDSKKAFLLPETAQSAYVNFKRVFEHLRKKLPLGMAVISKAYRNEIAPRNSLIRMREFSQAELQIFFDPDKIKKHEKFKEVKDYKIKAFLDNKDKEITCSDMVNKLKLPEFYVFYMAKMQRFFFDILKIPRESFRFRKLSDEEKAFYNKYHWDIELLLGIGWKEVAGCHYRTDHDLKGHQKISRQKMEVNIEGKKTIPHVLELSFGVDRNIYSLLDIFSKEEKERSVILFPRKVSTYDVAVFPLVNKERMPEKAREVYEFLTKMNFSVFYDSSGSIGRRYRRIDEIGVPAGITIDGQTLKDGTVTIRDRDTMEQNRISIKDLCKKLHDFLNY